MTGWLIGRMRGKGEQNFSYVSIFNAEIYWSKTHITFNITCTELHRYFLSSSIADIAIPANNAYYSSRHLSLPDMSPFSWQLQFYLKINGTWFVGFMSLFLWRVSAILTACCVWANFLISPIRAWCDVANWPPITEPSLIALFLQLRSHWFTGAKLISRPTLIRADIPPRWKKKVKPSLCLTN
jgi:hypothetical protein